MSSNPKVNLKDTIYVSSPEYYSIEYKINHWMNSNQKIDKPKAINQWNKFVKVLNLAGANVIALSAGIHPDTVFIADAGIIINNDFLLSNFKHPERHVERNHWISIAESMGYNIIQLPAEMIMEGTGDCLIGNKYAFLGIGNRSNGINNNFIEQHLQRKVIPLQIDKSDFFHLDTCMAYIADSLAIIYHDAISPESRKDIEKIAKVLYIDEDEAYNFAANMIEVNHNIIIQQGNIKIIKKLSSLGFNILEVDTSEFIKSGGSCKCLSLRKYSSKNQAFLNS